MAKKRRKSSSASFPFPLLTVADDVDGDVAVRAVTLGGGRVVLGPVGLLAQVQLRHDFVLRARRHASPFKLTLHAHVFLAHLGEGEWRSHLHPIPSSPA